MTKPQSISSIHSIAFEVTRQATRLLTRYKGCFPLPVDPVELFKNTYPDWVLDAIDSELVWKEIDYRNWNLLASARMDRLIHYTTSNSRAHDDYNTDVFWVKFPQNVLAGNQETLLVPPQFRAQILEWFGAVKQAEQEIHEAKTHITAATGVISTPAELQLLWPDLARAVHVRVASPGAGVKNPKQLKRKFEAAVGPIDIRSTSDLLAKCLLLPDIPLMAWLGRNYGEAQSNG